MKKFLFILFLAGAALLYFNWESSPVENVPNPSGSQSFQPDPSNASFLFDDASITLSQGRRLDAESGEETTVLDQVGYGDLNSDGKEDVALFLARSGGGSGVFIYAAAYVSGPVSYKGTNAAFLGDRVSPQSVSIANGIMTVSYLDRGEDEAFAAEPTIPVAKQFIYRNGTLVER